MSTFQDRVWAWMQSCFGPKISTDVTERNHRFLEEALELVQSLGCTASEAHQLVDYVYDRETGQAHQEVGGVMVTLAALCQASGHMMDRCGDKELDRVWQKIDKIREKQANKPKHSPLPQETSNDPKPAWQKVEETLNDFKPEPKPEQPEKGITSLSRIVAMAVKEVIDNGKIVFVVCYDEEEIKLAKQCLQDVVKEHEYARTGQGSIHFVKSSTQPPRIKTPDKMRAFMTLKTTNEAKFTDFYHWNRFIGATMMDGA